MAKTPLTITLDTPEGSIFPICNAAGLKAKEANEVYHSIDAVRVWRDRFEALYGELLHCVHHSNPDDPPDLTCIFRAAAVGVEHTRLEPSHYGWMNALHQQECPDQCITVPSITSRPKGRAELLSTMLSPGGDWSDVETDTNEWQRHCLSLISKKIKDRPAGVLVIQDVSLNAGSQLRPIVEAIHAILSPQPDSIRGWTILLHSRGSSVQFNSYLIAPRENLQTRSS